MIVEVKVPVFSESVSEGTLLAWTKPLGSRVERGDKLIDIETDKVVLEVFAPQSGVLTALMKQEGDVVTAEEVLAAIDTAAAAEPVVAAAVGQAAVSATEGSADLLERSGPAVRKLQAQTGVNLEQVSATGKDGRATKGDVLAHLGAPAPVEAVGPVVTGVRPSERVPMTRIRARIAERLKEAQNTAALLTTYNEVNMRSVMALRKQYQDAFTKKHGIKLGFMSFFVKAAVEALKQYPVLNASVDGKDIIYHGFYDIGIAVASERGLVVPIVRDADQLSLAQIEKAIAGYAAKARDNKLTLDDMAGGTFSITNGGTFGSMLSTPILNQPQSAILGMHNIVERPIVENGQIVAAPVMYLALSYDHRIIDGREAVLFLVSIKNALEDPARMLLDI
jgi:2-oxoglutarate dehydrogenase E2 component (dihydrolipoamide succinyltransferase)